MNTALDTLLDWYEHLTPQTVCRVPELYAPDAGFRDPFNNVRGTQAIQRIFEHMFESTSNPRFTIRQRIVQDEHAFVIWSFDFELLGKAYTVEGASHITFDSQGLVCMHRDYWDAAEELFQKLPLVGGFFRLLRRRFASA
ncbi:nuclear transport factor 2 family protein [Pseudoduganella violaceinigra]|uniref:nuclear transport factor 2 family protein n=1 Tax=Pseudoduganella violaceinigra TaxID=246602 RepID=UPI00048883C1|nr:nuclear transport factor 2 family protein [Pseudoduganella violaceinigra]